MQFLSSIKLSEEQLQNSSNVRRHQQCKGVLTLLLALCYFVSCECFNYAADKHLSSVANGVNTEQ